MIERLALTLAIALAGLAAYHAFTRLGLWWNARRNLGIPGYRPGAPAVLYFTSPDCAPCESIQKPALVELQRTWREMQVFEVDALAHPDWADRWGVLAVPTTFLLDSQGRPRRVNHGLARLDRLLAQFEEIGENPRARVPAPARAAEE